MAKIPQMNWMLWRAKSGIEPRSQDILNLLDSRDMAIKALRDIIAECPLRPTKPFAKRIKTLAQDGLNGSGQKETV